MNPLRVLIVDDCADDAFLLARELTQAGLLARMTRVETRDALKAELKSGDWDVVLADYTLPAFSGPQAAALVRELGLDTPVIIVSGMVGEDKAVASMKAGARDFIRKDNLQRLVPAILREREEAGVRLGLRDRERKLSLLFSAVPAVFWETDRDLVYTAAECTPAFGEQMQSAVLRLPGQQVTDYVAEGSHPDLLARYASVLRGERLSFQTTVRRKDLQVHLVPKYDTSGNIAGVIGLGLDVSQQTATDRALQLSEDRYRVLFETMTQGVVYQDQHGHVIAANPAAERILGLTLAELQGRTSMDPRWRTIHEDGSPFPGEQHPAMVALRTRNAVGGVTMGVFNPRDDDYRWIRVNAVPVRFDGEAPYVYATLTDVTERRRAELALEQSEQHFRALIENASDLITVVDPDGVVRYESPSLYKLLGYDPGAVVGRSLADFVHPDDAAALAAALRRCVEHPDENVAVTLRVRHRGGAYRRFEAVGTNQLGNPAVRGIIVNSRDTTEQTDLREQLFQAQKMEAVGLLAAGVAHDFNNLLTVILGNAEHGLACLQDDSDLRIELEEIREASLRAAGLTRQLLAFGRRQVMQRRPLCVNELVCNTERMLRRIIGETIQLECEVANDVPVVIADPGQVEQVLVNLAVNARDAMPAGGTLTMRTERATIDTLSAALHDGAKPGEYAVVRISDTGIGMEPAVLCRIFEPFFTTKEFGKGTGLGLATAFGIVRQSGGFMRVQTEPGRGSAFSVYLPVADEVDDAPRVAADLPAPTRRRGTTVLVVEDHDAVRQMTERTLLEAGYQVITASSGRQGLERVREARDALKLVITDIVMRELSGGDLGRTLRAERPDLPLLYMSGYADEATLASIEDLNADRFMEKPFTPIQLIERVDRILAGSGS